MKTYAPHAGQRSFHRSDCRFRALVGGRGSGKTTAGALEALRKIQERPGWPGLILAPSHPMFVRSTWPVFSDWMPWSRVTEWHRTEKRIVIDYDTPIYYGSLDDPDSFRGPSVNWLWLDEGGKLKTSRGWDIAIACLRVGPNPQGWVTTTPAGKSHWLYDSFVLHDLSDDVRRMLRKVSYTGDLFAWSRATIHQNRRNLDPLYYASLIAAYSGVFAKQELEGHFVSFEGLVYEEFAAENVTVAAEYNPELPVEWAIDDGYTNPRAILFLQRWPDGRVTQFAELYHTQHLPEVCIAEALGLGYPAPELAIYDPAAVELRARLRARDIVARPSRCRSVVEGIARVRRLVCDGNQARSFFVHPRCPATIREFNTYCYPAAPAGQRRGGSEQPIKENDHAMDALRYWIWNRVRGI